MEPLRIFLGRLVRLNICLIVEYHGCRPCYLYIDPFTMNNAQVLESISLDANEVLVVYNRDRSTNQVARKIQYGPMLFLPDADEWWAWLCGYDCVFTAFIVGYMNLSGMEQIDKTRRRRYQVPCGLPNFVLSQTNFTTM